jgi:hypothetical protein
MAAEPAATASTAVPSPARTHVRGSLHPLTDRQANGLLHAYDHQVKGSFDRIVPVLKRLSALQHEDDFVSSAQRLARSELGFELPLPILERAWVSQLDMRTRIKGRKFSDYGGEK